MTNPNDELPARPWPKTEAEAIRYKCEECAWNALDPCPAHPSGAARIKLDAELRVERARLTWPTDLRQQFKGGPVAVKATVAEILSERKLALAKLANGPWSVDYTWGLTHDRETPAVLVESAFTLAGLERDGKVEKFTDAATGEKNWRLVPETRPAVTLWVGSANDQTTKWKKTPFADREKAEDAAHDACAEATTAGREVVVLFETPDGKVSEFMITFSDDPDCDPWWSHRECTTVGVRKAKSLGFDIKPTEILGNYEPKLKAVKSER